jgi:hypothetical protein
MIRLIFSEFSWRKKLDPINPRARRGLQGRPLRSPCGVWQSANPAQIASLGAPKRLKPARQDALGHVIVRA